MSSTQWQSRKAQVIISTMIDACKAAKKVPWPLSDLIIAQAKVQCDLIASQSQFYNAASNSYVVTANTNETLSQEQQENVQRVVAHADSERGRGGSDLYN